jgi:thioredoxin reductase (NADPH)
MIIATGVRRRKLDVPGEEEFGGRGILESGVGSKDKVSGKTVLIVGGGDAALENALILSRSAGRVIVVHRRAEFTARKDFFDRTKNRPNVEFVTDTRVAAIVGNITVEAVELQNIITGEQSKIAVDAVLVRIGVIPNTELFRGQITLDAADYISIDSLCSSSVEGVYAVGDVANPASPTISGAAGMGAAATKAIKQKLR